MGKFKRVETGIKDLIVIEPTVFGDNRGFFMESYSKKGVLRGLHFQIKHVQGKLVRVTAGAVLDVAVDLRKIVLLLEGIIR